MKNFSNLSYIAIYSEINDLNIVKGIKMLNKFKWYENFKSHKIFKYQEYVV